MGTRRIRRPISVALSGIFGTSLVLCAGLQPARAQEKVERVQVTGSNIPRAQTETASPILVINKDELDKSGKTTVAEYLQTLSVDGQGSIPSGFGAGFTAGGATAVSLRGLGAASTLVLLNGRRMAAFGLADDGQKIFTDLSTIPMETVARIEILLDGASSIYGSDAIAGVVNIIQLENFKGTVAKAQAGTSRYSDGTQAKASVTAGFGNLGTDGYNAYFNFEASHADAIMYRDRSREWIGTSDLRPWGYSQFTGPGGGLYRLSGWVTAPPVAAANASSSPTGNVRNPTGGLYQSLPGCAQFKSVSPADPGGGCMYDQGQFLTMQPALTTYNLSGRGTWRISNDVEGYAEALLFKRTSDFEGTPSPATATWAYPGGVVSTGSTTTLAASHPDNPFKVNNVRLRYSAFDVGAQSINVDNQFVRLAAGLKGRAAGWDYDTAVLYSETSLDQTRNGYLLNSVLKAALGTPTSPYFPYRLGANAGLNPASLYAALSPTITNKAKSQMEIIDFKATREVGQLDGGPMNVAVGAEYRHEQTSLTPLTYTDVGDVVGAGYSAYSGRRDIGAIYAELLAPVLKTLELTAALRSDQYSQVGNATNPKVGIKYTPVRELALRGTYSEGFRAPSVAETGGGYAGAVPGIQDPVRCPNGKPAPGATQADCATAVSQVVTANSDLKPETSKSYTIGAVWDPLPTTSFAVDFWDIKRDNEINPSTVNQALAAGTSVVRGDNNLPGIPNSGSLLAVSSPYINSTRTEVRGLDVNLRHRLNLSEYGRLTFELRWSHLYKYERADPDGTVSQFAGTHGNCAVTNCIGTPKDKANLIATWELGDWRWAGLLNWRGPMANVPSQGAPCSGILADGSEAPNGCRIASFVTFDLSARWRPQKNLEVFGSIQNLFDRVAPIDPTAVAMGFNPMDISGAIGRYFNAGLRYRFN